MTEFVVTDNPEFLVQAPFPILTEDQLAQLLPLGERRAVRAGDTVFTSGQRPPVLVVVLSGRVEVIDPTDGDERLIIDVKPGEFVGELSLLTGQTPYATCVVREAGEVLLIPSATVQHIIATLPMLSDLFVTAFAARRLLLLHAAGASLTLIGDAASPDVIRYEAFVHRNRIPHRWLSPNDPTALALLERLGVSGSASVWVVLRGQKVLADPSLLALARALGLDLGCEQTGPADLLVVGAGPAG
ncbi:MAG: cyclic nucleotide-binding domain-containing protein, partial [Thermomicrobiales bacterium]|nr:cyclic nucleotide-binding domain-containing protein [Thermomicrobiales bacterium]